MKSPYTIVECVHDGIAPERAAPKVEIVDPAEFGGMPGMSAACRYKGKLVNGIAAPLGDGARARTLRIHELCHANNSPPTPKRSAFPALAHNAAEDCFVHTRFWPTSLPAQANRDALSVALIDARRLPPIAVASVNPDAYNHALLAGLRCLSIARRVGSQRKHIDRIVRYVTASVGNEAAAALDAMAECSVSRAACDCPVTPKERRKLVKDFAALMMADLPQESDAPSKSGNGSRGKDGKRPPMEIVELPLTHHSDSSAMQVTLARSGARINRSRLASAVATCNPAGLFIRQRYLPGGTYLFDASGSMNIDNARLRALCNEFPASTIAYYSGHGDDGDGCYGALCVYAKEGKRADEIKHRYGGNSVDEYAIRWLLEQPAPRVYIGDGGFCGGPAGQDSRAAAVLAGAVSRGDIEWRREAN